MKTTKAQEKIKALEAEIAKLQANQDRLISQVKTDAAILVQSSHPAVREISAGAIQLITDIKPRKDRVNVAAINFTPMGW